MACRLPAAQKGDRTDPPAGNPRKENIMETITTQGVVMPRLGFGTFRMPGADAQPVVESAIALGYRHIDTAAMYDNETAVGAAIAASGVNRNELFITTKVWHDQLAPDALYRAFDTSLRKLRLDRVDLYMIHWPSPDMDMAATLEALMSLRERGLTRAIGVCNFNLPMIRRAVEETGAPIASLHGEYHPFPSHDRKARSPLSTRSASGSTMRIARRSPLSRRTSASSGHPSHRNGMPLHEI